jgi:hypothetical protein
MQSVYCILFPKLLKEYPGDKRAHNCPGRFYSNFFLFLLFYYRLALTTDNSIRNAVHDTLLGVEGYDNVEAVLKVRYRDVVQGGGWEHFYPQNVKVLTFLVGEYRLPFVTSVEGLVCIDECGKVMYVKIRRTTDAF